MGKTKAACCCERIIVHDNVGFVGLQMWLRPLCLILRVKINSKCNLLKLNSYCNTPSLRRPVMSHLA